MPKKYHITVQNTPLEQDYLYKFTIERGENCINCGKCTTACIYEAHKRREDDPRIMADPDTTVCRNCFRCIQECPRGALEKSLNSDYGESGGEYWKPDILLSLWKQAETGSVPVSGAGYRGPFTGEGFDSMWTDMSEIVRPTRDGIHGREYISTAVDLGRKLKYLTFDEEQNLVSKLQDLVTVSIPVVFDLSGDYPVDGIMESILDAVTELDTFVILPVSKMTPDLDPYRKVIIPRCSIEEAEEYKTLLKNTRLVEIEYDAALMRNMTFVKDTIRKLTNAVVIIRVPADANVEDTVSKLVTDGAEVIHMAADYCGREFKTSGTEEKRYLKDIIRSVHARLVDEGSRDEISIIASGGIAMAEHVPKSMLCGVDLTAIDLPLLVALGAKIYEEPDVPGILMDDPAKIAPAVIQQRIVNLVGAWHSQILEMMGAMGIRDIRRLRGETGRVMFFEDLDKDTFGNIFGKR